MSSLCAKPNLTLSFELHGDCFKIFTGTLDGFRILRPHFTKSNTLYQTFDLCALKMLSFKVSPASTDCTTDLKIKGFRPISVANMKHRTTK